MLRSTTPRLVRHLRTHPKNVVTRPLTNHRIPPLANETSSLVPQFSRPFKVEWPATLRADWLALDDAIEPIPPEVEFPVEKTERKSAFLNALDEPFDKKSRTALTKFYTGMVREESLEVIRALAELKSYDSLHKVQDTDVIKLSQLLCDYLARCPISIERRQAEDIAVYLASRGSYQPLSTAMAYHLREHNYEIISSLWDQYAGSTDGRVERFNIHVGKLNANDSQLFAIAAAAIRDDFAGAVAAMKKTRITFASWRINEFIGQYLEEQPALIRQRFRDFLHDATVSRDVSRFGLLVEQVTDIARVSDHEALLNLYASIKDGLRRNIFVPDDKKLPRSDGTTPVNRDLWSLFVWGAVECQRLDIAEKFFKEMSLYNVSPSLETWNCLLHGYSKTNFDHMMEVVQRVRAAGLQPNVKTLSIIMGAMFDKKVVEQAMEIFETIRGFAVPPEEVDRANVTPQLLTAYNIALNGLLRSRELLAAEELLSRMQREGPFPDLITYNTLLNRYMHMKDKLRIAQTLRAMAEAELKPDIYTYTILFVGACRDRDEPMKNEIVRRMKATEVKPNRALLSAGIHSILTSGHLDAIQTAINLLQKMEIDPDPDLRPNEITYHTIMNAIDQSLERNDIKLTQADYFINYLHQRLIKQGLRPNRPILHLLMRLHLRKPNPQSLQQALRIFDQLDKEELLNADGWYIMLLGLEKRKEFDLAKEKIAHLRKSTWEARGSLLLLVDRLNSY